MVEPSVVRGVVDSVGDTPLEERYQVYQRRHSSVLLRMEQRPTLDGDC